MVVLSHPNSCPISCSLPNPNPNPNPKAARISVSKAPTPPWMKAPLPTPSPTVEASNSKIKSESIDDRAFTDKVSGVRGPKAISKIARSIVNLGNSAPLNPGHAPFQIGGFLDKLGTIKAITPDVPWSQDQKPVFGRPKKVRPELPLDNELLRRLRGDARTIRKWIKVNKAGITQPVVDQITRTWKNNELAMLKFDVPLCRNMDRARDILQLKTGGLVIWTKKDAHVIYRGCNYKLTSQTNHQGFPGGHEPSTSIPNHLVLQNSNVGGNIQQIDQLKNKRSGYFLDANIISQPVNGSLYEREADRLLDGLGPRYIDWWMRNPLPVDADLLPEVLPRYRRPFRLYPPRGRAKLTDQELTYLRKFARLLPTHFVLGRNRRLQGLAAAILKLWEKSIIVKIAVKWGIPNTSNEQMANELKDLTGGVLLLRNKFFIILFRGKDFVHSEVATLIREREIELRRYQLDEEGARLKPIDVFNVDNEALANSSRVGTLSEFQDIETEFQGLKKGNRETELQLAAENERLERELRKQERKLFTLNSKIERTAKELSKLKAAWEPSEQDEDQELITEEERECFRKLGLKMQSCLVLGRRGVFDGVMEGLHQHWKYREVARVITMQKLFRQVIYTARSLVAESGGVLVSVEKLKDGHVIILYRGKNYRRPSKFAHKNLLTKREALHRSLEMQRLGSLKFFAYQRQQTILDLKLKLADVLERLDCERELEVH